MSQFYYRPQLIPTIVCLSLFLIMLSLGRWQWQRSLYKQELLNQYAVGQSSEPLSLQRAVQLGRDAQGFFMQLELTLDTRRVILLDNQPQGPTPGLHVLTPAQASDGSWLLVNRGWLPWTADRRLPNISPPLAGSIGVSGQVYFPSDKQVVLMQDDFSAIEWPLLVQKVDLEVLSEVLGVELAPLTLRLEQGVQVESGEQLLRHWPQVNMSPEKHRAYSFQWFGMALALLILYLVFSIEKTVNND